MTPLFNKLKEILAFGVAFDVGTSSLMIAKLGISSEQNYGIRYFYQFLGKFAPFAWSPFEFGLEILVIYLGLWLTESSRNWKRWGIKEGSRSERMTYAWVAFMAFVPFFGMATNIEGFILNLR